jgi:hypothetical protein
LIRIGSVRGTVMWGVCVCVCRRATYLPFIVPVVCVFCAEGLDWQLVLLILVFQRNL